ncbi:MAG: hypothetical protein ACTSQL_01035 [Promethearchaeota archaeon]
MEIINKQEKAQAEVGDLIKFNDGVTGLVLQNNEIILLKHSGGNNWFILPKNDYKQNFKEGKYTIIAKAKNWNIVIK